MSVAVADILTEEPETVPDGDVIDTVGGVVSEGVGVGVGVGVGFELPLVFTPIISLPVM